MELLGILRLLFGQSVARDPDGGMAYTDIAPAWNDMRRIQEEGAYYGLGPVMRGQLNRGDGHLRSVEGQENAVRREATGYWYAPATDLY